MTSVGCLLRVSNASSPSVQTSLALCCSHAIPRPTKRRPSSRCMHRLARNTVIVTQTRVTSAKKMLTLAKVDKIYAMSPRNGPIGQVPGASGVRGMFSEVQAFEGSVNEVSTRLSECGGGETHCWCEIGRRCAARCTHRLLVCRALSGHVICTSSACEITQMSS